MSSIRNVAVIGASGNFGPAILGGLAAATFHVTIISREGSSSTFPAGIPVKKADFSSLESLKAAFAGQDAVISVVGSGGLTGQFRMIDAAIAAGVKRFVPSEYGVDCRPEAFRSSAFGKVLATKSAVGDYLVEKSKSNPGFSFSVIVNGLVLEFCLGVGLFGLNKADRTATIWDSGNEPLQTVSLAFLGKAVAAALQRPEQSANRFLQIAEFLTTQNQLLAAAEKATGGAKWAVTKVSGAEELKAGEALLAKGDPSCFVPLLRSWVFRDGLEHAPKADGYDNALLGLSLGDLDAFVKGWVAN